MPYDSLADLPDHVKKLSKDKQRQWMAVFNKTHSSSGEEKAFKYANASVKEGAMDLKENAPVGSFEYIRDLINQKIKDAKIFKDDDYPYVMYMYPERCIVSAGAKYYEVPYDISANGTVTLYKANEVEQYYVAKETSVKESEKSEKKITLSDELKESGITITKAAIRMDSIFDGFISLQEDSYNPATGEVEVVLIEKGTNPMKRRHYPESTIKEAAPNFAGLKMYINHPTSRQEQERPERDLKDWASTIVESWYESGKAMAKVAIHDDWLRERLKDSVARQHIGLSINAGGQVSYGKINGQEMQIVEKIILEKQNGPASVDWVTEAGARGRVSKLLKESGGKGMELKDAKLDDLKKENPELFAQMTESIRKENKESDELTKKDAQLKEANDKLAKLEETNKKHAQTEKVSTWLKENKSLPEIAKKRIERDMNSILFTDETKLKEAFDSKVKEELEYFNQISDKGKIRMGSSDGNNHDSSTLHAKSKKLMERMGIDDEDGDAEEEEDEDKPSKKKK